MWLERKIVQKVAWHKEEERRRRGGEEKFQFIEQMEQHYILSLMVRQMKSFQNTGLSLKDWKATCTEKQVFWIWVTII